MSLDGNPPGPLGRSLDDPVQRDEALKKLLFSAFALALVVVTLFACQAKGPWRSVDPEAIAAGRELLAVLETGEPDRLESYLASRTDLLGPERLGEEARVHVYDGDSIRRFHPRLRSVVEIIALGDIEILGAPQPDGSIILAFVPGRYLPEAQRFGFYTDEWMRKFFACSFKKLDGRWQLAWEICFAESDGPWPEEMA